jgi:hypothetical protein
MGPKRNLANLALARSRVATSAETRSTRLHDARRFTFSVLVTGSNYQQVAELFLWNDIVPPCSTSFYQAQKDIIPILSSNARSSANLQRSAMKNDTIISFDGSWSHRRNAKECVVVVIDTTTKRIIDYETVEKQKKHSCGTWEGSSNGMEVAALRLIIERLRFDQRIVGYVHDSDSKASAAIRAAGWGIEELLDPNHISKSFDRKWQKAPKSHLNGLGLKIKRWFTRLIHSDYSDEQKILFWRNMGNHFQGDHRDCPEGHAGLAGHAQMQDPDAIRQLGDFTEATLKLITRTRNGFDSQMCESFNAVKARYASKTFSLKISWRARIACAILQVNKPLTWRHKVANECGLAPIHPEALRRLTIRAWQIDKLNRDRRSGTEQEKERKRRRDGRNANARRTLGQRDYRRSAASTDVGTGTPARTAANRCHRAFADEVETGSPELPVPEGIEMLAEHLQDRGSYQRAVVGTLIDGTCESPVDWRDIPRAPMPDSDSPGTGHPDSEPVAETPGFAVSHCQVERTREKELGLRLTSEVEEDAQRRTSSKQ